ncbi:MAG: hypothetical protein ACRDOO_08770 [Actinomadura sp.]
MTHLERALLDEWMHLDCPMDEIDSSGGGCGTSSSTEHDGRPDC